MDAINAGPIFPIGAQIVPVTTLWLLRLLMGVPGLIVGILFLQMGRQAGSERATLYWAGAAFAQFLMMAVLAVLGTGNPGPTIATVGTGTLLTVMLVGAGTRALADPAADVRAWLWGALACALIGPACAIFALHGLLLLLTFALGAGVCGLAAWHSRRLQPGGELLGSLLVVRALLFLGAPAVVAVAPVYRSWFFIGGVFVFAAVLIAGLACVLRRRAAAQLQSYAALRKTEALLRVANDIGTLAAGDQPLAGLARRVVDQLHEVIKPATVMLHHFDETTDEYVLYALSGAPPQLESFALRIGAAATANLRRVTAGETLYITDLDTNPDLLPEAKALARSLGIHQQVAIPIQTASRLRGVLTLLLPERDALPDSWLQAAGVVARSLALALQLREQLEVLQHQATHDSLTGLGNRAALHAEHERGTREGRYARPMLMLIDLNRFKEVNDAFGHQMGDRLIRAVAERLQAFAGEQSACCVRLGGDEFALLFADRDTDQAGVIGERVQALLRQPFEIDALRITAGASTGIALGGDETLSSHELLRRADVAMYHAKTGDSPFCIYEAGLDPDARERLELASAVHAALENRQFHLFYQPKIRLRDGAVIGAEALIRWQHPQRGWIAPARFIPMLELGPLINKVSLWVAETALNQALAWRARDITVPIAINLSPRNLLSPGWCSAFLDGVRGAGLPRGSLEIEITETSLMSTAEYARAGLDEIAAAGIAVSIDDFGTGYSSLSYLQKLAIDTVKIDRSFVTELATKPQDAKLAASIVSLAKSLDLSVVAEGIENAATHAILRELGCDIGQGFHYARPLPAAEFEAWLRDYAVQRPAVA